MAVTRGQDLIYERFIRYNSTANRHLSGDLANKCSLFMNSSVFSFAIPKSKCSLMSCFIAGPKEFPYLKMKVHGVSFSTISG